MQNIVTLNYTVPKCGMLKQESPTICKLDFELSKCYFEDVYRSV
jgi:hypothetical protein